MKCPKCGYKISTRESDAFEAIARNASDFNTRELARATLAAKTLGSIKTPLKAATARENGKLGGRPLGSKNKPRGS